MILLTAMMPLAASAQFVQNSARSLFSDVKAFRQGDAIMVLIMEDTKANNGASTNSGRSSSLGGSFSAGSAGADGSLGTSNDFKGDAGTSRTESIRSRLSARVTQVDANGNLKIEGTRTTKINGEMQTLTIRGVVRPVDVLPDNSVYSYNILDLALVIDGKGSVTETQEPGLITKFLRLLF